MPLGVGNSGEGLGDSTGASVAIGGAGGGATIGGGATEDVGFTRGFGLIEELGSGDSVISGTGKSGNAGGVKEGEGEGVGEGSAAGFSSVSAVGSLGSSSTYPRNGETARRVSPAIFARRGVLSFPEGRNDLPLKDVLSVSQTVSLAELLSAASLVEPP